MEVFLLDNYRSRSWSRKRNFFLALAKAPQHWAFKTNNFSFFGDLCNPPLKSSYAFENCKKGKNSKYVNNI